MSFDDHDERTSVKVSIAVRCRLLQEREDEGVNEGVRQYEPNDSHDASLFILIEKIFVGDYQGSREFTDPVPIEMFLNDRLR